MTPHHARYSLTHRLGVCAELWLVVAQKISWWTIIGQSTYFLPFMYSYLPSVLTTWVLLSSLQTNHGCIFLHRMHDFNALWMKYTTGVPIVVDTLPEPSQGSPQLFIQMECHLWWRQVPPRASAKEKSTRASPTTNGTQPKPRAPVE